jgi:GNAT superfamily N-acetyltransferase
MLAGLEIKLVTSDDEFLRIVPLKVMDDDEAFKKMEQRGFGHANAMTEGLALDKLVNMREGADFWIALLQGQIVGYSSGKLGSAFGQDIYKSLSTYVLPDYREWGIGTALLEAQTEFARGLGCHEITATTSTENPAELRMHQKAGFSLAPISFYPSSYSARIDLDQPVEKIAHSVPNLNNTNFIGL